MIDSLILKHRDESVKFLASAAVLRDRNMKCTYLLTVEQKAVPTQLFTATQSHARGAGARSAVSVRDSHKFFSRMQLIRLIYYTETSLERRTSN